METTRGVKFCPDNPECIALLMSKVLSPDLAIPNIHDCNPYDHTHLPAMFSAAQKQDLYFFTKLTRKGKSGSKNANRTVGKGTWHGEQNRNVTYGDLGIVGTLHTFNYTEPGSVNDGCFLMTEYHLLEDTCLDYDPLKNHVLCILRANNSSASKKKRKSSDLSSNQEAAAAPMKKKKVRTLTAPPIFDQQPLAVEEAAFQKSETPQDAAVIEALPQVYDCDDGRFNNLGDPMLYAPPTAAAASSNVWGQIAPYNQYSCQVEASQFQTPLLAADSIYAQPLAWEDPNSCGPFAEPDLAPLLYDQAAAAAATSVQEPNYLLEVPQEDEGLLDLLLSNDYGSSEIPLDDMMNMEELFQPHHQNH